MPEKERKKSLQTLREISFPSIRWFFPFIFHLYQVLKTPQDVKCKNRYLFKSYFDWLLKIKTYLKYEALSRKQILFCSTFWTFWTNLRKNKHSKNLLITNLKIKKFDILSFTWKDVLTVQAIPFYLSSLFENKTFKLFKKYCRHRKGCFNSSRLQNILVSF